MDIETRRKKALAKMVRNGEHIPPGYDPAWIWVGDDDTSCSCGSDPAVLVLNESETKRLGELPPSLSGPLRPRDSGSVAGPLDMMGWDKLRKFVLERDGGRCFVCRLSVGDDYECGHIIDRMVGGPDRASNLVAMHTMCNRMKGVHHTREEVVVWITESHATVRKLARMSLGLATP